MRNSFGLRDPFYADKNGRFQLYKNGHPGEHQMLVGGKHFALLDRGVLNDASCGDQKALDYIMKQLTSADTTRNEVEEASLRGRNAELEMQADIEVENVSP